MDNNQSLDDNQLVKKYLDGESLAFEALVDRYQQRIYNFSLRIVQNADDAVDLTQEICIHLLRKIHTYRGEAKFSTWLYSIAGNTCKDFLRRKKSFFSLSESPYLADTDEARRNRFDAQYDPAAEAERSELGQKINKSIAGLPLNYRMVVDLHDMQGCSYGEISEILGISMGTVKSRLSRARFKLAKNLSYLKEQLRS